MAGGSLTALVVGGDEPDSVTGTEADGIEESGVSIAGSEQALESLSDAGGDGGLMSSGSGMVGGSDRETLEAAPLRGLAMGCNCEMCGYWLDSTWASL
jgi:hypothetical protein